MSHPKTKEDHARDDMRELAGYIQRAPLAAHRSLNGGLRLFFWIGVTVGAAVVLLCGAAVWAMTR